MLDTEHINKNIYTMGWCKNKTFFCFQLILLFPLGHLQNRGEGGRKFFIKQMIMCKKHEYFNVLLLGLYAKSVTYLWSYKHSSRMKGLHTQPVLPRT